MVQQETQSKMKVYELAKELGLDSISLLDKLSELNIKVKNHMSDLGEEEIVRARGALGKKAAASETKKATRVVRKKTDTAAGPATPAKTAAAAAADAVAAAAAASAKSSGVIRRRVKSDGEMETVTPPIKQAESIQAEPSAPEALTAAPEAETSFEQNASSSETPAAQMASTSEETQVMSEPATTVDKSVVAASTTLGATAAPTTTIEAGPKAPLFSRPVAPKRTFLKIVEAQAPPQRPQIKPSGGISPIKPGGPRVGGPTPNATDQNGFRIIRMTKENLDQMAEEEKEKKRGGGGREAEIKPEDVRFADYRKKEMVFLPKRKKIPLGKELRRTELTTKKAQKRVIEMNETISVGDLANQLGVKAGEVIKKLMMMGTMATINQQLDVDTTTVIAHEYEHEVRNTAFQEAEVMEATTDSEEQLESRPPVVTIMGHVDHGKTSLLDAIREANVAGGEAGGITQHIGAYTIEKEGRKITFIDTPGHEAFTVMRARGANVTDIVILVVAADDGVMPQTREALAHAKAAGVPIIVAMNKIDKPSANPEKIKQGLAELDLLAEDWGGQTMFVPVSAIKKTNLDKLLEAILLQAEVLELKANTNALASGTVLESRLEKGRGPMVSVLVKRGTLKVGDALVSGASFGRVKALLDERGRKVGDVTPATAAEILGFDSLPSAGERFDVVADEATARQVAENRMLKQKAVQAQHGKVTLEELFSKVKAGTMKELNVVLKADMFGSLEAIRDSLQKLGTEQVKVKVIHMAPGGITESDVLLASASNALIIGFNVRPETKARQISEAEHIEIKTYSIIYELIDDVKRSMAGLLDKKKVEKFLGRAEVRQTFSVPRIGTIAGCSVIDGKILRGANVRLLRDSRIIFDGKMSSLKRFKDDAKEVAEGFECGIGIENYNDLKIGDLIEAYQIDLIAQELA